MKQVVLDLETTGFHVKEGDRIVEIGCVEIDNYLPTGNTYHQYVNPERLIPEESINVHGITDEFVKDKPTFAQVALDFLAFIGDKPLVIHNSDFDMSFIQYQLKLIGLQELNNEIIDTLAVARKQFPGKKVNLDALARMFKIDITQRVKHGALLDSEILAEVYLALNGGKQGSLNVGEGQGNVFSNLYAVVDDLNRYSNKPVRAIREELSSNLVSEEDIQKHQQIIAKVTGG